MGASIKEIVEGLQILQKYTHYEFPVMAEHDEIRCLCTKGTEVPLVDQVQLHALGWFQQSDGDWSLDV